LILSNHKQIFGYTRTSDTKRAYVLTNLTDRVAQFTLYQGLSSSQLVLSNLLEPVAEHTDEKSFKFHPFEVRVYMLDYKKKEPHQHHHHHKKRHVTDQSENKQSTLLTETKEKDDTSQLLTKKQQAALQKLEQMSRDPVPQSEQTQKDILSSLADATTRALTETSNQLKKAKSASIAILIDQDRLIPPDSSEIDLENEPIHKKRERQRSLVLNL
ncbi:unnamed protein product, partial [Rotaria sordida]